MGLLYNTMGISEVVSGLLKIDFMVNGNGKYIVYGLNTREVDSSNTITWSDLSKLTVDVGGLVNGYAKHMPKYYEKPESGVGYLAYFPVSDIIVNFHNNRTFLP